MARTPPNKLPRSYFKRAKPSNTPKFQQSMPETSDFILGGRGTIATTGRQAFWANTFAKDIRNISRITHMEATMGSWEHYVVQGRLTPEVAIIVDGSVQRPIKHVKVFGEIVIQEPPNLHSLYDAVLVALQRWEAAAASYRLSGDYMANLHVFADNSVHVDPGLFISGRDRLDEAFANTSVPPFFTIINTMPYAAKQERLRLPQGLAYGTWKDLRGSFGDELALRFRYYTSDKIDIGGFQQTSYDYKRGTVTRGRGAARNATRNAAPRERSRYTAGKLLSFPAINIGMPGAFNSGASAVIIKARRAALKG